MNTTTDTTPLDDIRIGEVTAAWAKGNGLTVRYSKHEDSTNNAAKNKAFLQEELEQSLVLYVTDHQTQGRGRNKNSWIDAKPGSALLSSWSFQLQDPALPTVTCRMGLALYKAAWATWPYLPWSLKAPNDLYLGSKKLAGLLLETLSQGSDIRLIVGLGMNIFASPKELSTATSVLEGMPSGVPLLAEDYLSFLDRWFFEMSFALSQSFVELQESDRESLKMALNLNPNLQDKILSIDASANMTTSKKTISWMEL